MFNFNPFPLNYLKQLGDQIVSDSHNPNDRYHLGKLILEQMRRYPDDINQIDGNTGESESNGSVLARSISLGSALRAYGVQLGDVVMLMAPNHLDLCIPYYASFFIGAINMAVNANLNKGDLKEMLEVGKPKIIFCQRLKVDIVQEAITSSELDTRIVVFGEDSGSYDNLEQFSKKYEKDKTDDFRSTELNPAETIAFLVCTSGSTGLPKPAMITHQQMAMQLPYGWVTEHTFPKPTRTMLVFSPLQWITAQFSYIYSAVFVVTRLQTSTHTVTQEHAYHLINHYRPTWTLLNSHLATILLQYPDYKKCDFSSLQTIFVGGGAVPLSILDTLKTLTRGEVMDSYGMSEAGGFALASYKGQVRGSSGIEMSTMQYKIVDLKSGERVGERQNGELLIKGPPSYFKGYYKNPKATKEAFAEGGWFRTGDIFYRDGEDYFFVDRIKLMLEYKHHLISPLEIEKMIGSHPGVAAVAVGGRPHAEDVDHITACVVRKEGFEITQQEIEDFVKAKMDETRQLRGGVIFLDEMPLTHSLKLDRMKIKEVILSHNILDQTLN